MTGARDGGLLGATVVAGSVAGVTTFVALGIAAEAEGAAPLRPINASSHWLNGDAAGAYGGVDIRRTSVGFATNHAVCLFWALPFAAWQRARPAGTPLALLRDAAAMAAVAAAVDYGATPRRYTPGWELVLSKAGMALAYAGLAAGLALGTAALRG